MEFQNIKNMGESKLNSFKILFFGDSKRKVLLDGIDWQRKEYELLTAEKRIRLWMLFQLLNLMSY